MTRVMQRCPNQQPTTAEQARKVTSSIPTVVKPALKPQPKPEPKPQPKPPAAPTTYPRFPTCKAAKAAGYGPYRRGVIFEYPWYKDNDGDGIVCEV